MPLSWKKAKSTSEVDAVQVAGVNGISMAVLKMALVVVLALGTKKFAIWITISALSLVFLEYAGKQVTKIFKLCLNSQKSFNSLIQWVSGFLRINHDKLVLIEEVIRVLKLPIEQESDVSAYSALDESRNLNPLAEEIQILQPNSELGTSDCNKKWGCEELDTNKGVSEKEEDHSSDVVEIKRRRSRSTIKSKIRKLVKKKLGSSLKKKGKDLKSEEFSYVGDYKVVMYEEQEEREEEEEIVVGKELKRETERNSGYLILFLIVLVGLLGGRGLALVITFSWCLMLKLAVKLRRLELGDHHQVSCQISI